MWHVAMKACAAHRAAPRTFGWATSRRVRVMRCSPYSDADMRRIRSHIEIYMHLPCAIVYIRQRVVCFG
jgi:hypothetical protein